MKSASSKCCQGSGLCICGGLIHPLPCLRSGQPFALAIPPLSTLSTDEQYTIQRYLMFTTRLSLLEALLRAHPPGPFPAPTTTAAMPPPTPTPAVSPAVNRNQVAAVMTLLAMNLIKYVIGESGWPTQACLS